MSDSIVKVKKNSNGEITDYVLSSGKTVSKAEGVKLAEEGMIVWSNNFSFKERGSLFKKHS